MAPGLQRLPSGAVVHRHGAGAPLLFLHGVGGAAWSWAPQVQALAGAFECRVWEGRGHGAAARVADAGLADYLQDAREALHAAWAERGLPVLLVAHSMGAMPALALAVERPAQVRGLFLVDPVYAERGDRPAVLKPLLWALGVAVAPLVRSYHYDGAASRVVSRFMFRRAFVDAGAMERAWALQRTVVPLEYPRMLTESIRGVEGFPFVPFAERITAPVCFLEAQPRAGARSRFAAVVRRWRARPGQRCEHEALHGGHYLQLDRPAEVTARLRDFALSLGAASTAASAPCARGSAGSPSADAASP